MSSDRIIEKTWYSWFTQIKVASNCKRQGVNRKYNGKICIMASLCNNRTDLTMLRIFQSENHRTALFMNAFISFLPHFVISRAVFFKKYNYLLTGLLDSFITWSSVNCSSVNE